MTARLLSFSVLACASVFALEASAQVHFTGCASATGSNATIMIPASIVSNIDGRPLNVGDEIAVFTPAGQCAGVVVWAGSNTALTVWGDDSFTEGVFGQLPGTPFSFRVWDASADVEYGGRSGIVHVSYSGDKAYYRTDGLYVENGIYVLSALGASLADTQEGPGSKSPQSGTAAPLPGAPVLEQNYPNPFNPSTTISYRLQTDAYTSLDVLNVQGQRVALLVSEQQPAGDYSVTFDSGADLPSGVYFYRLVAGAYSEVRPMLLAK